MKVKVNGFVFGYGLHVVFELHRNEVRRFKHDSLLYRFYIGFPLTLCVFETPKVQTL